jgi:hypothetical protein
MKLGEDSSTLLAELPPHTVPRWWLSLSEDVSHAANRRFSVKLPSSLHLHSDHRSNRTDWLLVSYFFVKMARWG